jgi:hypothetical protein
VENPSIANRKVSFPSLSIDEPSRLSYNTKKANCRSHRPLVAPHRNETKMKFAAGVTTAIWAIGTASAFAPQSFAAKSSSRLSIATEPVYTFTKSEEIFAEAQEVRKNSMLGMRFGLVIVKSSHVICRRYRMLLSFYVFVSSIFWPL